MAAAVEAVRGEIHGHENNGAVAAFPGGGVVAGATEQLLGARTDGQRVVADSAEQLGGGQRAVRLVERNRIVAALAEHLDRGRVGDGGLTAIDGHGAAVHKKLSSRVTTSHDGVIDAVTYFGK